MPLTAVIVIVGLLALGNFLENQPKPPLLSIKETPLVVVDSVLSEPVIPQVASTPIKLRQVIDNNFRQIEKEVVVEVNKFRKQNNLATLTVNKLLISTAKKKGEYLVSHNLFEHHPNNISLDEWFDEYFDSKIAKDTNGMTAGGGENLAQGFKSAKEVVDAWIASEGHRENMLNDHFNEIGVFVGVDKDGHMLTVLHLGGTFSRNYQNKIQPKGVLPLSVYYPLSSPVARSGEAFSPQVEVESQIREIARQEDFKDTGLLVRLAMAESSLNPLARQQNGDWSVDRGLYQWNSYFHENISDECSYSVDCSTRAVIEAIKEGHLEEWWGVSLSRM